MVPSNTPIKLPELAAWDKTGCVYNDSVSVPSGSYQLRVTVIVDGSGGMDVISTMV